MDMFDRLGLLELRLSCCHEDCSDCKPDRRWFAGGPSATAVPRERDEPAQVAVCTLFHIVVATRDGVTIRQHST